MGRDRDIRTIRRNYINIIRVMIHQPSSVFEDDESIEFAMDIDLILHLRRNVLRAYTERTYASPWVIAYDLERDVLMSATEAQTHGVVDLVGFESENENFVGGFPHGYTPQDGPPFLFLPD
ncbi:hypothetical protein HPP92_028400 [Vanilla planifolia]|uniref:ATP-dependent Clp protease proteolytic subunit n=2 Tax=Vanilla planifolia TaxID=51239 RepID=A0A835PB48_VANPL|nr:hypothetical protein HPP92_028400 [Vanilla planifolia]